MWNHLGDLDNTFTGTLSENLTIRFVKIEFYRGNAENEQFAVFFAYFDYLQHSIWLFPQHYDFDDEKSTSCHVFFHGWPHYAL